MSTIIVGGGPAGMVCAAGLIAAGQTVTLVDEQPVLGGHLRYDPYDPSNPATPDNEWTSELADSTRESEVTVCTSTIAWAAYRTSTGFEVALSSNRGPETLFAANLVVATGTTDRELPVPGATLPGVMTERAARILIGFHGVVPGARCAVVGTDVPRLDRLVQFLEDAGVSTRSVPTTDVSRIAGTSGVEYLKTTSGDRLSVDFVVIARGERPDTQLAGMLEADRVYRAHEDGWAVPTVDCGGGLHVVGGAFTGSAAPIDFLDSVAQAVKSITGGRIQIPAKLAGTSSLLAAMEATA
jgi:NADPH-dependent 2,4-dienoyl-CoA reductase/sulfur reductase-like enzyme